MQTYSSISAQASLPTMLLVPAGQARYARFPPVPTLLATRLQLEFLLSERSVDLRAAAGILLNDPGATLQIFRYAGEGSPAPSRLEDCLAGLGTEAWMKAVSADAVERVAVDGKHLAALTGFWERARARAYACWFVAEHREGVCPREAYLVGLLEEAACLPTLLGWAEPPRDADKSAEQNPALPARLAAHWCLPEFLRAFLTEPERASTWQDLLRDTRLWANGKQ